MDMMEKKLDSTLIYDGKIIKVEKDTVLTPNGKKASREVVRHNGGAAILCITKDNLVLLERQFRYSYNEIIYEIPAGKLEKNEDPYFAAIRELEEETGYKASSLIHLIDIYPTCGYSSEIIYIYLAKDYIKTETHFDFDEVIESKFYPLDLVKEMILDGRIKDAKTICAINAYCLRYLK